MNRMGSPTPDAPAGAFGSSDDDRAYGAAHGGVMHVDWFDAMLFDLDGIITSSARGHGLAWKSVFDEFLTRHGARLGVRFEPFDAEKDYHDLVDGKPRYDGAHAFVRARGIDLPFGEPTDSEETETCCGLGNRKNRRYLEYVESHGVDIFETTASLMRALYGVGKTIAVVSASKNAEAILTKAGLAPMVSVIVSGREATAMSLAGKPAPDTYIAAANLLGVPTCRAVVFEDSVIGVHAAAGARAGLIVGVNRADDTLALLEAGADIVVSDLGELVVDLGPGRGTWHSPATPAEPGLDAVAAAGKAQAGG